MNFEDDSIERISDPEDIALAIAKLIATSSIAFDLVRHGKYIPDPSHIRDLPPEIKDFFEAANPGLMLYLVKHYLKNNPSILEIISKRTLEEAQRMSQDHAESQDHGEDVTDLLIKKKE